MWMRDPFRSLISEAIMDHCAILFDWVTVPADVAGAGPCGTCRPGSGEWDKRVRATRSGVVLMHYEAPPISWANDWRDCSMPERSWMDCCKNFSICGYIDTASSSC